ncbi:hypothetical protein BDY19DRAFT_928382 [Irpex rosettiformis]|uniref:Uncharacterized protein n=1 Tax=Irpex rosettiformis TaxID=378272 RepID=A0ACB8UCR9_9APHY|nr:hypothetical protein BDY19DRAFT_928382 [Irpex rosettiformis]
MGLNPTQDDVLAASLRTAKGDVATSIKHSLAGWIQFANPENRFGYATYAKMEAVEMSVEESENAPGKIVQAQLTFELDTTEDMCNVSENLSGGCIMSLLDCSALVTCRLLALHIDPSVPLHVSLNIGANIHGSASLGSRLRIICTTMSIDTQTTSSKVEIFDKTKGRLVATGWNTKMLPSASKL